MPNSDEWSDFTDEQLRDLEQSLFDSEVEGFDTWPLREAVLWEMNRRGLYD